MFGANNTDSGEFRIDRETLFKLIFSDVFKMSLPAICCKCAKPSTTIKKIVVETSLSRFLVFSVISILFGVFGLSKALQ